MSRRILVTGATGFLGQHLCKALTDRGDFVVALVRDIKHDAVTANVEVIGSFEQVERAIAEYECDTVVHLGAQTQVSTAFAHPVGTFKDNIEGTWTVLEACRRQKVKYIVIASSDKCYGDGPSPYVETQPLLPHGIYATSKACADMLASAYRLDYDMPIATTRCGNLYGPGHRNWSTLIPGTIRSFLQGESPFLRSNGDPKRDYLYVEDAVEGYLRLIDTKMIGDFNFGTGIGTSALDVAEKIRHLLKAEPFVRLGERSNAKEIEEQILFCTKAKALGWAPKHTLGQGLVKTIEWYREYLNPHTSCCGSSEKHEAWFRDKFGDGK